jgi:hypothetical protein
VPSDRRLATGLLLLAIVAALAVQVAPFIVVSSKLLPALDAEERPWDMRAAQGFARDGVAYESTPWLAAQNDARAGIGLVRAGGPVLAAGALLLCAGLAAVLADRLRLAAGLAWGGIGVLAAGGLGFLAALSAFNADNGHGTITERFEGGLPMALAAAGIAATAAILLHRLAPRRASRPAPHARSARGPDAPESGDWRPPVGYDPGTGLYVGDRAAPGGPGEG